MPGRTKAEDELPEFGGQAQKVSVAVVWIGASYLNAGGNEETTTQQMR
jgi:hypothetical protein